jgi:myosin heavy subunit
MRREKSSFLEISQDPLLTILALVLFCTVSLVIPTGARMAKVPSTEQREEVRQLEERRMALEAELRRLKEERNQLDAQLATHSLSESESRSIEQHEDRIAALRKQLESRTKQMEALQAELRRLEDASNAHGGAANAALQARLDELREAIDVHQRELDSLEMQIQAAGERAAAVKAEQDGQKSEIARLQNEAMTKRAALKKLQEEKGDVDERNNQFTIVGPTQKPKDVQLQLANNRLIPIDLDHYVRESGFVEKNGLKVPAARLCRKSDVLGDDLTTVGTPQSSLSKVLSKVDPKTERLLLLVNPDSFEMLRKALDIISKRKEIEVGWWPDSDVSPCFVTTGEETSNRPPSPIKKQP